MATSATPPLSDTWLDALPEEICDLIAKHVTSGKPSHSALNLAAVSRKQTRSTALSLTHPPEIRLGDEEYRSEPFRVNEDTARWVNVFAEYPFKLKIHQSTPFGLQILRQPSLFEACIPTDRSDILTALCDSRSIRRLSLLISSRTYIHRVIDLVSSLTLEELTFIEHEMSAFIDLTVFALACVIFIEACGPSTRFYWHQNNGCLDVTRSYWDAVALLPDSVEIKIASPAPESIFPKVSQFRSVEVGILPPKIAARLGSCVVRYSTYFVDPSYSIKLGADDVLRLKKCRRIMLLNLCLRENAQNAMVELVSHLPCLKNLRLWWSQDFENLSSDGIVKLRPGVMLNIVRACPKLESLNIANGEVSMLEWEEILAHVGIRLRSLHISKKEGKSEICAFLFNILPTVRRYCKQLEYLGVTNKLKPGRMVMEEQVAKVLHLAWKLQIENPILNGGTLEWDMYLLLSDGEEDTRKRINRQ